MSGLAIPDGLLFMPARIVKNPTTNPEGGTFPFGGTELGKVNGVRVIRHLYQAPLDSEQLGTIFDVVYSGEDWEVQVFFSTWNEDVISTLYPNVATVNGFKRVDHLPSDYQSGSFESGRAIGLLVVPDNDEFDPFCYIKAAIPNVQATTAMEYRLRQEGIFPAQFKAIPPSSGEIVQWGPKATISIA